jgi:predicted RNase H-like HicB family nuclease
VFICDKKHEIDETGDTFNKMEELLENYGLMKFMDIFNHFGMETKIIGLYANDKNWVNRRYNMIACHFMVSHHKTKGENMKIEIEREADGRWLAEVAELPGVMAYGDTRNQAISKTKALALRILADRLEHDEEIPELKEVFTVAA